MTALTQHEKSLEIKRFNQDYATYGRAYTDIAPFNITLANDETRQARPSDNKHCEHCGTHIPLAHFIGYTQSYSEPGAPVTFLGRAECPHCRATHITRYAFTRQAPTWLDQNPWDLVNMLRRLSESLLGETSYTRSRALSHRLRHLVRRPGLYGFILVAILASQLITPGVAVSMLFGLMTGLSVMLWGSSNRRIINRTDY